MTLNAPIGIVCGSGINLESLLHTRSNPILFDDCTDIMPTSVTGHQGLFVPGTCHDIPIILQCGRLHFYEGHGFDTVVAPVDKLKELGAQTIIFTSAAGGLKPDMKPGDLLAAESIALWPSSKWRGHPSALNTDISLDGCDHIGTYTWIHGPSYETQAEIHALQSTESDAIGMSTAPEIARCKELNIRTASISCITNNCCSTQTLTHAHVIDIAAKASHRICQIIRTAIQQ